MYFILFYRLVYTMYLPHLDLKVQIANSTRTLQTKLTGLENNPQLPEIQERFSTSLRVQLINLRPPHPHFPNQVLDYIFQPKLHTDY